MESVTTTMNRKDFTKYVAAFTYGDGGIYKLPGHSNCRFEAANLEKNKDYIDWRADILSDLTAVKTELRTWHDTRQPMLRTRTMDHPFYTNMWQRFYLNGHKTIDPHYMKLLDFETLAIWYMDDGNGRFRPHAKSKTPEIRLATHNFTYAENLMIKKAFKDILDLEWNIQQQKTKKTLCYYLSLRAKDYKKLYSGIKPFIKPSFDYKLFILDEQQPTFEAEDIV